jgi:hypothetical protein
MVGSVIGAVNQRLYPLACYYGLYNHRTPVHAHASMDKAHEFEEGRGIRENGEISHKAGRFAAVRLVG